MATLGDLERAVMDLLWDGSEALPATELRDGLSRNPAVNHGRDLALTTVLTSRSAHG